MFIVSVTALPRPPKRVQIYSHQRVPRRVAAAITVTVTAIAAMKKIKNH